MQTHVNEWRALRDAYARRAAAALARHFQTMPPDGWQRYCEQLASFPLAQEDGVHFLASRIGDYSDNAAVLRFAWLADKVWQFESEALVTDWSRWDAQNEKTLVA